MSPWVGRVRNFVPYPLSFSSPGSGALKVPVVWLLWGSFLEEPRDSGQSVSRRVEPTSLGGFQVGGAGAAECVCLCAETGS